MPDRELVNQVHAAARTAAEHINPYGLAHWDGAVTLGEFATTDTTPERIAVVYGDPLTTGTPCITVHTTNSPVQDLVHLVRYADYGDGTATLDDELPALQRTVACEPAEETDYLVDGRPVRFHLRKAANSWYAWAELTEGRGLLVEAAHAQLPDSGLAPVGDLEPFLAGHLDLLERAGQIH